LEGFGTVLEPAEHTTYTLFYVRVGESREILLCIARSGRLRWHSGRAATAEEANMEEDAAEAAVGEKDSIMATPR
jgi:hypothetical protein